MKLVVNGEEIETDGARLADLVEQMGARPDRVAVMVNGEVIAASARDAVALKTGDRIEVLTFAAGG
ncbi:MAG: sulfur carrier protein ThiS [Kiritimatiellia bacterium]